MCVLPLLRGKVKLFVTREGGIVAEIVFFVVDDVDHDDRILVD